MFEPPQDNFNRDLEGNSRYSASDLESEKNLENIDANLSAKNVAIRKKQLEKIFLQLIAFGLAVGLVLGIGAYYLINKLGLNKKPYQLEREKIEREKRERSTEQTLLPSVERSPDIAVSN